MLLKTIHGLIIMEGITDATDLCFKTILKVFILPILEPNFKTIANLSLCWLTLEVKSILITNLIKNTGTTNSVWFIHSFTNHGENNCFPKLTQSIMSTYYIMNYFDIQNTIHNNTELTTVAICFIFPFWLNIFFEDRLTLNLLELSKTDSPHTLISRGSSPGEHSSTRLMILISPS